MDLRLIDVTSLTAELQAFSAERDWDQFHTPKNLAIALAVEAAELLEPFQWLTPEQATQVTADPDRSAQIAEELADVLIYLVRLADILGIDLNQAVAAKLADNARKYPADQAKGSSAKYTELDQ
jgi:dCTP diphosphatase